MVMPDHSRELGARHVARNAAVAGTVRLVPGMRRGLADLVLVAGRARVVRLRSLEAVPAARRVAMHAAEFTGRHAWADQPRGGGVVLAEVPPIGVEIGVLEGDQPVVVEIPVAGPE